MPNKRRLIKGWAKVPILKYVYSDNEYDEIMDHIDEVLYDACMENEDEIELHDLQTIEEY